MDAVALAELEKEGVRVEPHAATLAVIQVGGIFKKFFKWFF